MPWDRNIIIVIRATRYNEPSGDSDRTTRPIAAIVGARCCFQASDSGTCQRM